MGRHDRAWAGMQIVICGQTPVLPMQIEQAFVRAAPGNEVSVSSFENYEDAYDFVKASRDVGLIIVLENCGGMIPEHVFRELAKPYEVRGFPCFGVMIHEGRESFRGLRALKNDRRILDYIDSRAFTDPARSADIVSDLWETFNKGFEEMALPMALQDTLRAVACTEVSDSALRFYARTTNLLMAQLNVSWVETFAIRWAWIVDAVDEAETAILAPHPQIRNLAAFAAVDTALSEKQVEEIVRSKAPLPVRIATIAKRLACMQPAELEAELSRAASFAKPGAPAVLRHLARLKEQIVSFAGEESEDEISIAVGE